MVNKKFLPGLLVMVLAIGLTVVGCDNDPSDGESDTWSDLTNFDQMNGTWKTTYSQNNRPVIDVLKEYGMDSDMLGMLDMYGGLGDMRVTASADVTLTINANDQTLATSMKATATFSGENINTLWPILKEFLTDPGEEGVTIDLVDKDHSVIMSYKNDPETITEEDKTELLNSGLQINQTGKKIKMPANTEQGTPELIFTKQ